MRKPLTASVVRSMLRFDGEHLYWRDDCGKASRGKRAGTIKKDGYVGFSIEGRFVMAHRIIWLFVHGDWPQGDLDHINGVRSDNRIENLRPATKSQNNQNRRPAGSLGLKGVTLHQCGQYQVMCNGKYIGLFKTATEAAQAYDGVASSLFGDFARLNAQIKPAKAAL